MARWGARAGWVSVGVAALVWLYLLARLEIFTAAMGKATPLLAWLRAVWSQSEDMGHGPFLPLVSLYAIYLRRHAIRAGIGRPDWRGLALIVLGALIFWAGMKTEDVRIYLLALVLWTWSVPFAAWGAGVARQLVFPAGYLLLSIPIDSLVIYFTMQLRLLAAAVAVAAANGFGIATERIGTGLHSLAGGGFNLDVAEPCSGLRSIFAMTALAAAYAFFTQKKLWKQWLLFACAVPVAVVGNVVRIIAIILVAVWRGEQAAAGFYHDYSGYIVFLVAILLLFELGRWIGRLPERRAEGGGQRAEGGGQRVAGGGRWVIWAVAPLVLAACVWMVRNQPPVETGRLDFLARDLPARAGDWTGHRLWHCHNESCMRTLEESEVGGQRSEVGGQGEELWPMLGEMEPQFRCPVCGEGDMYAASLGEQRLLPADTRIMRARYRAETGAGGSYTVTLVVSGTGRNSLHRPELCIPAQGFVMQDIRDAQLPGSGAPVKLVELERTEARGGGVVRMGFAYGFFDADRETASHVTRLFWTGWDRAFHNRATRWVMVTVVADHGYTDARAREAMLDFMGGVYPLLRAPPGPAEPEQ